jgi:competence protein ComEA
VGHGGAPALRPGWAGAGDLNAADAADLQRLPGIGPVGARRIVEERDAAGPYRTVGDLVRVAGFGPSRVRGLGGRLKV